MCTNKLRRIKRVFRGPGFHMVGDEFRLSQYLPGNENLMGRLSLFLLLDYNVPYYYEPSSRSLGVGAHPHRGFETVTIAYSGKVEHHDNKGNHGVIVISEEVKAVKGPEKTFTDINLYNVKLENNGIVELNEPSDFNTGILLLEGTIKVNKDRICKDNDFILFDNVEGTILVEAVSEDALFLVLSGKPINEPIVSHGPFVMNTVEEIHQAYEDFRNNKFGTENF